MGLRKSTAAMAVYIQSTKAETNMSFDVHHCAPMSIVRSVEAQRSLEYSGRQIPYLEILPGRPRYARCTMHDAHACTISRLAFCSSYGGVKGFAKLPACWKAICCILRLSHKTRRYLLDADCEMA